MEFGIIYLFVIFISVPLSDACKRCRSCNFAAPFTNIAKFEKLKKKCFTTSLGIETCYSLSPVCITHISIIINTQGVNLEKEITIKRSCSLDKPKDDDCTMIKKENQIINQCIEYCTKNSCNKDLHIKKIINKYLNNGKKVCMVCNSKFQVKNNKFDKKLNLHTCNKKDISHKTVACLTKCYFKIEYKNKMINIVRNCMKHLVNLKKSKFKDFIICKVDIYPCNAKYTFSKTDKKFKRLIKLIKKKFTNKHVCQQCSGKMNSICYKGDSTIPRINCISDCYMLFHMKNNNTVYKRGCVDDKQKESECRDYSSYKKTTKQNIYIGNNYTSKSKRHCKKICSSMRNDCVGITFDLRKEKCSIYLLGGKQNYLIYYKLHTNIECTVCVNKNCNIAFNGSKEYLKKLYRKLITKGFYIEISSTITSKDGLSTTNKETTTTKVIHAQPSTYTEISSTTKSKDVLSTTNKETTNTKAIHSQPSTYTEISSTTKSKDVSTTNKEIPSTTKSKEVLSTTYTEISSTTKSKDVLSTTIKEISSTTKSKDVLLTTKKETTTTKDIHSQPSTYSEISSTTKSKDVLSTTKKDLFKRPVCRVCESEHKFNTTLNIKDVLSLPCNQKMNPTRRVQVTQCNTMCVFAIWYKFDTVAIYRNCEDKINLYWKNSNNSVTTSRCKADRNICNSLLSFNENDEHIKKLNSAYLTFKKISYKYRCVKCYKNNNLVKCGNNKEENAKLRHLYCDDKCFITTMKSIYNYKSSFEDTVGCVINDINENVGCIDEYTYKLEFVYKAKLAGQFLSESHERCKLICSLMGTKCIGIKFIKNMCFLFRNFYYITLSKKNREDPNKYHFTNSSYVKVGKSITKYSVEECAQECYKPESKCNSFVFHESHNTCDIYVDAYTTIFMPYKSKSFKLNAVGVKLSFTITSNSKEDCIQTCIGERNHVGFQFNEKTFKCYVYLQDEYYNIEIYKKINGYIDCSTTCGKNKKRCSTSTFNPNKHIESWISYYKENQNVNPVTHETHATRPPTSAPPTFKKKCKNCVKCRQCTLVYNNINKTLNFKSLRKLFLKCDDNAINIYCKKCYYSAAYYGKTLKIEYTCESVNIMRYDMYRVSWTFAPNNKTTARAVAYHNNGRLLKDIEKYMNDIVIGRNNYTCMECTSTDPNGDCNNANVPELHVLCITKCYYKLTLNNIGSLTKTERGCLDKFSNFNFPWNKQPEPFKKDGCIDNNKYSLNLMSTKVITEVTTYSDKNCSLICSIMNKECRGYTYEESKNKCIVYEHGGHIAKIVNYKEMGSSIECTLTGPRTLNSYINLLSTKIMTRFLLNKYAPKDFETEFVNTK